VEDGLSYFDWDPLPLSPKTRDLMATLPMRPCPVEDGFDSRVRDKVENGRIFFMFRILCFFIFINLSNFVKNSKTF
jgi:hypothetical protein